MHACEYVRVSISMRNSHLAHALPTGPPAGTVQLWVLPEYDVQGDLLR